MATGQSTTLALVDRQYWVPDESAPNCANCDDAFSLTRRRHHCRLCGKVFCDGCCTARMTLNDGNSHRVCILCVGRLAGPPSGNSGQLTDSGMKPSSPSQFAPPGSPTSPSGRIQCNPPPPIPADVEANLQEFQMENDINPIFMSSVRHLYPFDIVLVCDDSGSMSAPADPEIPGVSRWLELKQSVQIVLRATAAMGKSVDLYFLNRGKFLNIQYFEQIAQAFARPPSGITDTVGVMKQIWHEKKITGESGTRPTIVHLFTDGHPTNQFGSEDMFSFENWLRTRPALKKTYVSINVCTDDEEICEMYRPLEYRVKGQLGWQGPTTGIPGVDVTEDYRGELKDVRRLRGRDFRFTVGDYIVKCLVGAIDPTVHAVDLPVGVNIYLNHRSQNGCSMM